MNLGRATTNHSSNSIVKNIQYTHPTNEKLQQPILDIIDTYIIPTILYNINKLAQMAPGGKTTQTQNQWHVGVHRVSK
jgi:hypothetical protein